MKHILIDVPPNQAVIGRLQTVAGIHLTMADPVTDESRLLPANVLGKTNILFSCHVFGTYSAKT